MLEGDSVSGVDFLVEGGDGEADALIPLCFFFGLLWAAGSQLHYFMVWELCY